MKLCNEKYGMHKTWRHKARDINHEWRHTAQAWIMNDMRHETGRIETRPSWRRGRLFGGPIGDNNIAAVRDDCVHDVMQSPAACGELSSRTLIKAYKHCRVSAHLKVHRSHIQLLSLLRNYFLYILHNNNDDDNNKYY